MRVSWVWCALPHGIKWRWLYSTSVHGYSLTDTFHSGIQLAVVYLNLILIRLYRQGSYGKGHYFVTAASRGLWQNDKVGPLIYVWISTNTQWQNNGRWLTNFFRPPKVRNLSVVRALSDRKQGHWRMDASPGNSIFSKARLSLRRGFCSRR